MKNCFFWIMLLQVFTQASFAQGENNIWLFDGTYIDFNTIPPSIPDNADITKAAFPPVLPETMGYANDYGQAVCNAEGSLRFYVRLHAAITLPSEMMVFSADGSPIANSLLRSDHGGGFNNNRSKPVIVGKPGNSDQYYIFYSYSNGILYTLLDMSLNDGMGGIVTGMKDIKLTPYGAICTNTTLAVQGCEGVWLLATSATENEHLAYHITSDGIDTIPVRSPLGGGVNSNAYNRSNFYIKASADGKRIAATYKIHRNAANTAWTEHLEVYNFEKCSGKLTNPRILDTGFHASIKVPWEFENMGGFDFSKDGSKFYLIINFNPADSFNNGIVAYTAVGTGGCVYQYDLGLTDWTATVASKTRVLNNPRAINPGPCALCCAYHFKFPFKDLKRGPDGRIYIFNNASTCAPGTILAGYSYDAGYHVIQKPNLSDLASEPETNVLGNVYGHNLGAFLDMNMPKDVVFAPSTPDTIAGDHSMVYGCYSDSVLLVGAVDGRCYQWNDGVFDRMRRVGSAGHYEFGYFDANCNYHIDTFQIEFMKLPQIESVSYSCPGSKQGTASIRNSPGDAHSFTYEWKDASGFVLRTKTSAVGDDCAGLDTGLHYVRISTESGCDTTLEFFITALPVPVASFEADTIACKGEPVQFTNTSASPLFFWYSDWRRSYLDRHPQMIFNAAGDHDIYLVVQNIEGCYDTAYKTIQVKELNLALTAAPDKADRKELVHLQSSSELRYKVLAWYPGYLFANQTSYDQRLEADTSMSYQVVGVSTEYGCIDTAETSILVDPVIVIPDAFSPNGDGLNDCFTPVILGKGSILNSFVIFNRWGQPVFEASGQAALLGWDGQHGGRPADLGVYHYIIQIATLTGNIQIRKGSVTLVR